MPLGMVMDSNFGVRVRGRLQPRLTLSMEMLEGLWCLLGIHGTDLGSLCFLQALFSTIPLLEIRNSV